MEKIYFKKTGYLRSTTVARVEVHGLADQDVTVSGNIGPRLRLRAHLAREKSDISGYFAFIWSDLGPGRVIVRQGDAGLDLGHVRLSRLQQGLELVELGPRLLNALHVVFLLVEFLKNILPQVDL